MQFRIGINLGEVLVEGEQIYGDGVNIAARIQSLADAGGICVSGGVHEQVGNKVTFEFESLGEQTVKNIAKPVHIYRLHLPSSVDSSAKGGPEPSASPDTLSVAVLPFATLSDEPEQEHFSDGITRDLITDLAKVPGLAVVAASSVFAYKGLAVNVQTVGRDLGVRYVVEGSVRKAGERVRITAELIDVASGLHVWAERYDREVDETLALQDELVSRIVAELVPSLPKDGEDGPG
jgi:adenylate cyclase